MKRSKGLHIALWVVQVLLAALFGMIGFMKTTAPISELAAMEMSFVNVFSEGMVRFIGVSELLGALGLVLPSLLRIRPSLTPIAASALSLVMILAAIFHLTQGESPVPNIVLFALTAFVAWGRFKKAPILAK